jgi:hypothetical protein
MIETNDIQHALSSGLPGMTCCASSGACSQPAWNHWQGEMLCKHHWYERFDAHNAAEAKRRWCPFCGAEAVVSDAPREMFDEMADDDEPMTCAGDCYIQGVSIPRSEWPIRHNAELRDRPESATPPHNQPS